MPRQYISPERCLHRITYLPHLEHIVYHFIADSSDNTVETLNMPDTGQTISAADLIRGVATRPKFDGGIIENSGAD